MRPLKRRLGQERLEDLVEPHLLAEMNITPLTDIFLVLLVIFMVGSSLVSQSQVEVTLPTVSSKSASNPQAAEGVLVTLLPSGGLLVNQKELAQPSMELFHAALKKAFEKTKSRLVILEGDRQALLGFAVQVMDEAQKAGASQFAIATQNGEVKSKK